MMSWSAYFSGVWRRLSSEMSVFLDVAPAPGAGVFLTRLAVGAAFLVTEPWAFFSGTAGADSWVPPRFDVTVDSGVTATFSATSSAFAFGVGLVEEPDSGMANAVF